ncbi:hypothetical protein PPYR_04886 [Photinus pyralis]|uniref:DDE Tnp4 domain-containing protein n=1 Tax=Photinus pyralis TaxID=7054 RepID=A0A1Y1LMV8_PHOPY|nr:putative nuclease HARBI1 [Photinus pyralis]XP_031345767.1 putative nuclease HARBI1 [Photinus pyralis]XP_031352258.1 putative nuclease HARBI1 [Photinus pyralis]KAB0795114.1 hypothetical protein PPYR_11953 [Photinus pyralis]KAB0797187.1 hypothetical protein PPYR_08181 [Photinus pyralis]KAB0802700.1 hypothetical protein PPYR_04886 [Photinus pyralis]
MDQDYLLLLHMLQQADERYQVNLRRRTLRDASNPMTMPESTFMSVFRLSRELAQDVIDELSPHLRQERGPTPIPIYLRILVALHFYGQGSYQKGVGKDYHLAMSQSSVSRCIAEVTDAINEVMVDRVNFPTTFQQKNAEKLKFAQILHGFPGIIGAIDCTHVAIQSPPVHHPEYPAIVFYNRKGYYSINTQIICSADLKILNVNARFPGSVHDSAIWTTSAIYQHLRDAYNNGDTGSWLIGDSGYPLQPWLMTPLGGQGLTPQEQRYNVIHKRCRNVIERLNGVLKGRFRCLLRHRTLHYSPLRAAKIINACCILHNLCIERRLENNEEWPNEEDEIVEDNFNNIPQQEQGNVLHIGRITRRRIIDNYIN